MIEGDKMQERLAAVLPPHMDALRLTRIAVAALAKNPKLEQCKPVTIAQALIHAAEVGLEVNGWDGHLVPYGKECQFQADYKGMVKLAYQSDLIGSITAEVVREDDTFHWRKGTTEYLDWEPSDEPEAGRPMTHVWAMATIKGGGKPFIVMTLEKVMQHKAKSKAASASWSPWNDPLFEESMWKKTAIRMLCKILPRSSALTQLLIRETAAEAAATSAPVSPLKGLLGSSDADPIDVDPEPPSEPQEPADDQHHLGD
jgi:recombination protein RecT